MSAKKSPPIVISDEHNEIKLYTVKGRAGAFYQLSFYRAGQRQRKSFADLNEAKREARLQLSQLAGERLQAKTLSTAEMESYTLAAQRLEGTGIPLHVSAELFAEAHRMLQGQSILDAVKHYLKHHDPSRPRKPLSDLVVEFEQTRRAMGVGNAHLLAIHWATSRLVKEFADVPLNDLDPARLDEWLQECSTWTNRSRNNCRIVLVTFGNFLKKRGYLPTGTPTVFERMSALKNDITPVTIFTAEEMGHLLSKASAVLLPYLAIGAFAGLRNAEVRRLDWSHIRFDRGFIECEAGMTKTRRRRLVPLQDNLRAWLEPLRVPAGPVILLNNLPSALCSFGERAVTRWRRNALRHSYISYRLALMPDTARVALECGNSPDMIFQHYRELVTPEEAKAWFNIMPPADYPKCLLNRGRTGKSRTQR